MLQEHCELCKTAFNHISYMNREAYVFLVISCAALKPAHESRVSSGDARSDHANRTSA